MDDDVAGTICQALPHPSRFAALLHAVDSVQRRAEQVVPQHMASATDVARHVRRYHLSHATSVRDVVVIIVAPKLAHQALAPKLA